MSDSKSQDHWKALALLLDVSVPEEESVEDSLESADSSAADSEADWVPADEGLSAESEVPVATEASKPSEPLGHAKEPPRSRPAPPRPTGRDSRHWIGLASKLGIEVTDEELEEPEHSEEPEPPVVQPAANLDWQQPPQVEQSEVELDGPECDVQAVEDEPVHCPPADEIPDQPEAWQPPWTVPEVEQQSEAAFDELAAEDQSPAAPAARSGRTVPSLFDDVNFSIDTPGALDRIFDEHWGEEDRPAIPAGFEERDAYTEIDDDLDESTDLPSFEEDDEGTEGLPEASGKLESDEGEEPRRRRRRRRRRKKTAKNGTSEVGAEKAEPGVSSSEDADDSASVDQDFAEIALDGEHEEDPPEDHDEDDEDDLVSTGVKHRKIPTWDEAVGVVISANLEARAKNPGNGPRGRGRGRGRRS
jgi:hypothetical protein